MDALASPATILASSTSSIPASAFTEGLPGRARCLIAHPVNPPYLVPVVEICGAPWTDAQVIQQTWDVMEGVGQKPVKIHRELKGFVLNRLQGALLREAFRLVEQGYVDAEGLDVTVREGLGLRWSFMGPFETIDLNAPDGLADYARRFNEMYQSISTEQTSTEPWSEEVIEKLEAQRREILPKDQLLARRLWRDRRLMALAAHKQSAE
jgi:3-hydroxyacyl-CoA dehydrogenase